MRPAASARRVYRLRIHGTGKTTGYPQRKDPGTLGPDGPYEPRAPPSVHREHDSAVGLLTPPDS